MVAAYSAPVAICLTVTPEIGEAWIDGTGRWRAQDWVADRLWAERPLVGAPEHCGWRLLQAVKRARCGNVRVGRLG